MFARASIEAQSAWHILPTTILPAGQACGTQVVPFQTCPAEQDVVGVHAAPTQTVPDPQLVSVLVVAVLTQPPLLAVSPGRQEHSP